MAFVLDEAKLRRFLPVPPSPAVWVAALNQAMARFAIDSPQRAAAFLAQVAHESQEFRRLVENLHYSVGRLMAVWPKRFPTPQRALPYERQPERLANYVYAKRLGNGDVGSGDGWRYRGRGLLQITGRGNYRVAGQALGLPLEGSPELLERPEIAALAAGQFWEAHGLNELADDRNDDNDDEDFVTISIRINGGREGLRSRKEYWRLARVALA